MSGLTLVAGATGQVGRAVLARLPGPARAAVRPGSGAALPPDVTRVEVDPLQPASWAAALQGVTTVVSALGAPVTLNLAGRAGYGAFDLPAHAALGKAAADLGVRRVIYVSVYPSPGYDNTRYVQAHLEVEALLRAAVPSCTAVRPTGVYTALHDLLTMARRGLGVVMGDGTARTNPIHPLDVADAVVGALDDGPPVLSIGGPEVLTRAEILETAFRALDRRPRLVHVPAALIRWNAALIRPLHPRLGELMAFAVAVSTSDGVAPRVGQRRLLDYFRALAVGAPR